MKNLLLTKEIHQVHLKYTFQKSVHDNEIKGNIIKVHQIHLFFPKYTKSTQSTFFMMGYQHPEITMKKHESTPCTLTFGLI